MRAAIFIDGGYILNQFKQSNIEPDWEELADYFLAPLRQSVPLDLLRCYFYYCPPYISQDPSDDEIERMKEFETFTETILSNDRWAMRLGKLQKRKEGNKDVFEQKRVDVLLSVDMVRHAAAGHIQHAVLIAGDSDFIPAVEAAKESGVTLSLWCGNYNTVHNDLIALADEVHQLDWKYFPRFVPEEVGKSSKKKTESRDRDKPVSNHSRRSNQRNSNPNHRPRPKTNRNSNKNSDNRNSDNRNSDNRNNEKKSNNQRRRPYKNRDKIPRVKKDEGSSWTEKFLKITNWSDKS